MTGPEHAVAAAAGAHRRSGEYLHRAVDRHQAGLHTELRVAFADHAYEIPPAPALRVAVWISGFATLAAAPRPRPWQHRHRDGRSVSCGVRRGRSPPGPLGLGDMASQQMPGKHPNVGRRRPASDARAPRSPGPACVLPRISHLSSVSFARSCCRFLRDLVEFKSLRRIATCLMRPRGIASAIPACPARSASVRCIVMCEPKPSAMRSPAGADGWWPANAAIPPPGRTPGRSRASPDQGNRPGVGGPSGTKTYGETRENLHDERNGARALPVHADERRGHTPIAPLVACWVAAVSVLLAFASPAFAHEHPKDNLRRAFSGYAGAAGQRGESRAQYGRHLQFTLVLHRPGCR